MTSPIWETVEDIVARTKLPRAKVEAAIKAEHRLRGNTCRFVVRDGKQVIEYRRK